MHARHLRWRLQHDADLHGKRLLRWCAVVVRDERRLRVLHPGPGERQVHRKRRLRPLQVRTVTPATKTAIKATLVAAAIGGGVALVAQVVPDIEPTGLEQTMVTLPMPGASTQGAIVPIEIEHAP